MDLNEQITDDEIIARKIIELAEKGNMWAIEFVLDAVDGEAPLSVETGEE